MTEPTQEHLYYNALATWVHGDYRKLAALLTEHGSWTSAHHKNAAQAGDPETLWKKLAAHHIRLVLKSDNEFPALLREIPWQPHALYLRGATLGLEKKIAVVGTRKATAAGIDIAKRFSQELAAANLTIVSGLALGVDAAAHEGALAAKGKTIGVLACGLDTVYPRQNEQLARKILSMGGTLVSEYPIGVPTYPARFIERNRITSGLSLGAVVVEAPQKSGSLATARFAIEQNREVFVVPGMITNPNYAGSHQLIRSGAQLVTSSAEILEHLEIKPKSNQTLFAEGSFDKLGEKHKIILRALQKSGMPLTVDELVTTSTLTVSEVSGIITELTLDGIIKEENGTYFIT